VVTRVTPARNVGCWLAKAVASNANGRMHDAKRRFCILHSAFCIAWRAGFMDTSIMSAMKPTRREMLGALAAASAATLVDPGPVLARMAADVPCVAGGAPGQLLGTLSLFRNKPNVQAFGVKYGGPGLDARMVTDLSLLEPGKLITPNELAYIRTPAATWHSRRCSSWTTLPGCPATWGPTCSNARAMRILRTSA
jgi:hypothetical protein